MQSSAINDRPRPKINSQNEASLEDISYHLSAVNLQLTQHASTVEEKSRKLDDCLGNIEQSLVDLKSRLLSGHTDRAVTEGQSNTSKQQQKLTEIAAIEDMRKICLLYTSPSPRDS